MSKFTFHQSGTSALARPIYDVKYQDPRSGRTFYLGLVTRGRNGWVTWVRGADEDGYPTRNAAAERLLLVAAVNPAQQSALPSDPFEGVSA